MRVTVYWNLNKGGWSVANVKGKKGRGKVIDVRPSLVLAAPFDFTVQPSGRQSILNGGHKQVHAWITGELVEHREIDGESVIVPISYNPRKAATFYKTADGSEALAADYSRINFFRDRSVGAYES